MLWGQGLSSFLAPFYFGLHVCSIHSLCLLFFFSHAVLTLFSDCSTTVCRMSHEHLILHPPPLLLFLLCVLFVFFRISKFIFFVFVLRRMSKHTTLAVNTITVSTLMSIANGGYILGQSGRQHVSCVNTFFSVAIRVHNDCRQQCAQAAAFWYPFRYPCAQA